MSTTTEEPAATRPVLSVRMHHIGIQTDDLANCTAWYRDFLGARPTWTLDEFSDLTLSRLPGMERLTELAVGDLRFHLFAREQVEPQLPGGSLRQFQHVCLATDSPEDLRAWRGRWLELQGSGAYRFARPDPPTEVVTDADGVQSFYTYDVNGLEFEFTFTPEGPR
jgi:catechol 2,3-dioxygenase-like lactoylglutathione lyase family enzyme